MKGLAKMSRFLPRRGLLFAFAALLLIIVSACGGGTSTGGNSVNITFLEKWPEPQYAPYFQKVVADYEQLHPNVHITLEAVGDQPYKDKIRVLTAANELPDIYFTWAGDFANKFIRGGLSYDLTNVFNNSSWHTSFSPATVQAFTYQGHVYAIPIDLDAKYFAYNTAIFKQYGLQPPQTFTDLMNACSVLKSHGIQPIAFGNQYGWPAIHYLTTLNNAYVPQTTLNQDYNPATGQFTNPGYVQALTTFKQIDTQCLTPNSNGISHESAQAQLLAGKAAMQYIEVVEFPNFTQSGGAPASFANNWSFFKFPDIPGATGNQACLTGAPDGFMVSAHSKYINTDIDFLKFFTSQANAQLMTKMLGWGSPVIGSATPQNTYPQLQQAIQQINQTPCFNIWLDTVTQAQVAQAYLSSAEGLIDGTLTPSQAVGKVQAAAQAAKTTAGSS
jgi:raffinose/stachyose/melibiose transport system substrate-binding protein